MNYLLDTHALIWFFNGDQQLSDDALSRIENPDNSKYVSMISLWEISIKIGLGKLEFDGDTEEIARLIDFNGFELLPISIAHLTEYEKLPFLHRDPFDRLLVCQAIAEALGIITKDVNIRKYKGIHTYW